MLAIAVLVSKVFSRLSVTLRHAFVLGHFEFGFDGSETRVHECVVVAVGCAAHALPNPGATQNCSKALSCLLPATIAVMDQVAGRPP
jgi:hypothetical protein